MAKKTCSKGHIYDSAIYGDNCPFCPSGTGTVANHINAGGGDTIGNNSSGTEVNQESGRTFVIGGTASQGPTISMGGGGAGGGTIIRPAGGNTAMPGVKKIMGLLVTYDTIPSGQVFNIYEGKNFIGRSADMDIIIQGDAQVSGKHCYIRYLNQKFKIKDESTNGTYLNEIETDEGELSPFDKIRIGSTKLIFIAIPQIQ